MSNTRWRRSVRSLDQATTTQSRARHRRVARGFGSLGLTRIVRVNVWTCPGLRGLGISCAYVHSFQFTGHIGTSVCLHTRGRGRGERTLIRYVISASIRTTTYLYRTKSILSTKSIYSKDELLFLKHDLLSGAVGQKRLNAARC